MRTASRNVRRSVDGDRLCGLVSLGDLVKNRLDELELEANILRENLIVSH